MESVPDLIDDGTQPRLLGDINVGDTRVPYHPATYHRYMSSPEWAAKRRTLWAKQGRRCRGCGTDKNLHVHHLTYARLGNECLSDLVGVCGSCHEIIHSEYEAYKASGGSRSLEAVSWEVIGRLCFERRYNPWISFR